MQDKAWLDQITRDNAAALAAGLTAAVDPNIGVPHAGEHLRLDGTPTPLTEQRWLYLGALLGMLPDQSGMIFEAQDGMVAVVNLPMDDEDGPLLVTLCSQDTTHR